MRNTGHKFFLAAEDSGAPNILIGAPFDCTASFRPGSRFGPEAIRQASYNLEDYSLELERSLADVQFYDQGDLEVPLGNTQRSLDLIEQAVAEIFLRRQRPFVLGGEHLITLPCLRATAANHPGLTVVHIDAHADLRQQYLGERHSHATVIGQAIQCLDLGAVYQFGIRSATREEHMFAARHTRFFPFELARPLKQVVADIAGPVYVTLDIDVVDPGFAPGTGTPESGGISPRELFAGLHLLSRCNVVGFDLVEVAPGYDPAGITAALAAKVTREALILFGKQP